MDALTLFSTKKKGFVRKSFVFKAKIISNAPAFQVKGPLPSGEFCIRVCEKPVGGKANLEIVRELAKRLNASARIVHGLHSNRKTIQVDLSQPIGLERLQAIVEN